MAAEFIGWRGCPLQMQLGPDGFVSRLRMLEMKHQIDAQVPDEPARQNVVVEAMAPDGSIQRLTYEQVVGGAGNIDAGIAECEACMLTESEAIGCRQTLSYPIDAAVERLLFEFFSTTVTTLTSTSHELWKDVIRHQPQDSPWHSRRPPSGAPLAELATPLSAVIAERDGHTSHVDSAMLLGSLLKTSEGNVQVVAYHKWWTQLMNYADRPEIGDRLKDSRTWQEVRNIRRLFLRAFIFGMHEPVGVLVTP